MATMAPALDPVNFYRRSLGTRLLGLAGLAVSGFVLVAGLAGGGISPPFALLWGALFALSLFFSLASFTDGFELAGRDLIYHAPLARFAGRPARRVFPLGECSARRVEKRLNRVLVIRRGRETLLVEGIEAWEEFAGRVEAITGGRS